MTMEKEQVLVLENITKAYGTRFSKEKKRVLGPVSLCIRKGEAVGITGENGAGKSTLLSVAAGIERQDAGKIELAPLGRGQLGYVPQEIALYPALTGMQNLAHNSVQVPFGKSEPCGQGGQARFNIFGRDAAAAESCLRIGWGRETAPA